MADYEDLNDGLPGTDVSLDWFEKIRGRGAALPSRLQSFETRILAEDCSFAGLTKLNRELVAKAEAMDQAGGEHRSGGKEKPKTMRGWSRVSALA
jgi:hypothetical protein